MQANPIQLTFNCLHTAGGYYTPAGVPMKKATYTKSITRIDDLSDVEKAELLQGYIEMKNELEAIKEATPNCALPVVKQFNLIVDLICAKKDMTFQQVKKKTRKQEIVYVRHLCMYILKRKTTMTYRAISQSFGQCDHSTSIHAYHNIQNLVDSDWNVRNEVNYLLHVVTQILNPKTDNQLKVA